MGLLSIAIPTRNRPESIKKTLENILEELIEYNIDLYLSDNSTDDRTETYIKSFTNPLIHYFRNTPPTDYFTNVNLIISASASSSYVWPISDSSIIKEGAIGKILETLKTEPDFVFLSRVEHIFPITGKIDDFKHFLVESLWHLTKFGTTVFSKETILLGKSLLVEDNPSNDFIQIEILLNAIMARRGEGYSVRLISDLLVSQNTETSSYWRDRTIEIWAVQWPNLIDHYSDLFSEEKIQLIIQSHARNTKMLSSRTFLYLRSLNLLSFKEAKEYENDLKRSCFVPFSMILLICIIPVSWMKLIYFFLKKSKNLLMK